MPHTWFQDDLFLNRTLSLAAGKAFCCCCRTPPGSEFPASVKLDAGSVRKELHCYSVFPFHSNWTYVHYHFHCVDGEADRATEGDLLGTMWFARLSASSRPMLLTYSLPFRSSRAVKGARKTSRTRPAKLTA